MAEQMSFKRLSHQRGRPSSRYSPPRSYSSRAAFSSSSVGQNNSHTKLYSR